MAVATSNDMGFVPMTSIEKKADRQAHLCADWVATEKIHGSSFQIYSDDGVNISKGSRRKNLDNEQSFVRCNIKALMEQYKSYAIKAWQKIHSEDRWEPYREASTEYVNDEDDDCDDDEEEVESDSEDKEEAQPAEEGEICRVRIYGELYGGGGIKKSDKLAVQKEIIYCDDFRFYVFGITINKKWVTIPELGDICKEAGFPYYAKQVCEPKATVDELKEHLKEIGFMRTRSSFTEKEDNHKALIEGVVMTPLKRPDFRLHAVKFLAPAFTDVRLDQFCKTKAADYCTKQRYHSVISKLDIDERNDTRLVVNMYIQDIIKEMKTTDASKQLKEKWGKMVLQWLAEDEYNADEEALRELLGNDVKAQKDKKPFERNFEEEKMKRAQKKSKKVEEEEDEEEPVGIGLFD